MHPPFCWIVKSCMIDDIICIIFSQANLMYNILAVCRADRIVIWILERRSIYLSTACCMCWFLQSRRFNLKPAGNQLPLEEKLPPQLPWPKNDHLMPWQSHELWSSALSSLGAPWSHSSKQIGWKTYVGFRYRDIRSIADRAHTGCMHGWLRHHLHISREDLPARSYPKISGGSRHNACGQCLAILAHSSCPFS